MQLIPFDCLGGKIPIEGSPMLFAEGVQGFLGPPVPFYVLKKAGTLSLTSLLENQVVVVWFVIITTY